MDNNVSKTTKSTLASIAVIFLKCENKTLGIAFTNSSIGNASIPDMTKNNTMLPTDLYVKPNSFINAPPKIATTETTAIIIPTIMRKPIAFPR